jgi:hypothetical protein
LAASFPVAFNQSNVQRDAKTLVGAHPCAEQLPLASTDLRFARSEYATPELF